MGRALEVFLQAQNCHDAKLNIIMHSIAQRKHFDSTDHTWIV